MFGIAAFSAAITGGAADSYGQTSAVATGNWSDPLTWSAGEPNGTTSALVNGGFTVTLDQAGEATNLLDLGTIAGETGNVTIAAGADLTVSNVNPANFPSSIRVGANAGSTGHVTMTGGTVAINGAAPSGFAVADLLVGDNGTGTWTHSGGTLTAADEVFVGLGGTSNGTLSVSAGTVNVAGRNLLIAFFGGAQGTLNLSGTGAINVDELLFSSFDPGAISTINQTGGTLTVGAALVHGRQGNATYNHSAGSATVTTALGNGDFVVGDNGPNNFYNISGTAAATAGRDFLVGVFGAAQATVNQSGGTVSVGGVLRVGIDGVGTWNQTGGTTTVAGSAWLGDFDSSLGTFKSTSGALSITGNLSVGAALASNAPPAPVGTDGQALDADGVFIVSGSGGTVDVGGNLLANPDDNTRFGGGGEHNDSTLVFEVLDNTGVSVLDVAGIADLTGAEIDVDLLGGSFGPGSFFDLITAIDISADYLQAAEDVGAYSLAIVPGGNGEILRATVVPEPATLALADLGLVVLGLHSRKKR
jgi:hypothetical protein